MPQSDISPATSLYQQIAGVLEERIKDGEYPRGSMLPSEWELAEQFNVSRVTINKAVGQLRAAGLVRVERGRGVAVASLPRIERRAQARYKRGAREKGVGAYDVEMRKLGLEAATELTVQEVPATKDIARRLGMAEGDVVFVRRRRMLASGEPTQLADTYVPLAIAEAAGIKGEATGAGGMYSRLADAGMTVA
ncbi:MAG: GntR family transcriptional regulator, partial [Terriglobales bacterium]